jgi:hypothetical protein
MRFLKDLFLFVAFYALLGIVIFVLTCHSHGRTQAPCPLCRPQPTVEPATPVNPPTGVTTGKIRPNRHTLNGRDVTEAEAHRAIRGGLPSDASMPFLVIIGPLKARQRVLTDLTTHPALSRLRARWRVQDYAPEEWAVSGKGFVTTGAPTIYCESADGKVLHRQDSYDGPDALAVALRKADPDYKPDQDPDLRSNPDLPALAKKVPVWAYAAAIGGVGLFFLHRRRK